MNSTIASGSRGCLKVQFAITWNDCHTDAVPVALRDQRFEDLRGRQANLGSNCLSGKIRGVHFLLTQFPADSQLIP
jgi:hypothetical protein